MFQNKDADKTYLGFTDDQSRQMLEKAKQTYEQLFALKQYSLIPISATTQTATRHSQMAVRQ